MAWPLRDLARSFQLGYLEADQVIDAYRQAMGPKARNRGAIFNTECKAAGYRPMSGALRDRQASPRAVGHPIHA